MGDGFPPGTSGMSADTVAVSAAGAAAPAGTAAGTGPDISAAMAARSAGENFPVALRLLPARHRQHLMAVYGFARTVDDIGDKAPVAQRARLLDELEADLGRLYAGCGDAGSGDAGSGDASSGDASSGDAGCGDAGRDDTSRVDAGRGLAGQARTGQARTGQGDADQDRFPELSVVRALGPAVTQCAIPQQPFLDLIQANRQDQLVTRYPAFDDLAGYCRLSANPVGRIVLHVFGAFTPARAELSDQVCTALQLAEHWQDVGEDFLAGRIYLPGEDMTRYGCAESDLSAPRSSPALRALVAFETRRASALLDAGAPLVGTLRGFARVSVAGYVAGGRAALAAIAAADHDVLGATPRPGTVRTAAQLLRSAATGR